MYDPYFHDRDVTSEVVGLVIPLGVSGVCAGWLWQHAHGCFGPTL